MMKKIKLYLDTSVINFLFANDAPDLQKHTKDFFESYILKEKYEVYISKTVIDEINKTKEKNKRENLLKIIVRYKINILPDDNLNEIELLSTAYIKENILPSNKKEDALHIAYAVVNEIDVLVSWNFKHLANINKERQILVINQKEGYFYPLRLTTPLEVMSHEN